MLDNLKRRDIAVACDHHIASLNDERNRALPFMLDIFGEIFRNDQSGGMPAVMTEPVFHVLKTAAPGHGAETVTVGKRTGQFTAEICIILIDNEKRNLIDYTERI